MRDLLDGGNDPYFLGLKTEPRNENFYGNFDGGAGGRYGDEDLLSQFDGGDYSNFLNSPGYKLFKKETGSKKARNRWKKLSNAQQSQYKERAGRSKLGEKIQDKLDDAGYCKDNHGVKRGVWAAKKGALIAARGAFLALLRLNYRGFATRMGAFLDKDPNQFKKLEKTWCKLGGSVDSLIVNINKAKNKKPLLCGAKCKAQLPKNFSGYAIDASALDYSNVPGSETAATAAVASPILLKIGATLTAISAITGPASDIANDVKNAVENEENAEDQDLTPDERREAEENFEKAAEAQEEAVEAQTAGFGGGANKLLLPLGIAAIAVVLLKSINK